VGARAPACVGVGGSIAHREQVSLIKSQVAFIQLKPVGKNRHLSQLRLPAPLAPLAER
jgi:hypothetical protein